MILSKRKKDDKQVYNLSEFENPILKMNLLIDHDRRDEIMYIFGLLRGFFDRKIQFWIISFRC